MTVDHPSTAPDLERVALSLQLGISAQSRRTQSRSPASVDLLLEFSSIHPLRGILRLAARCHRTSCSSVLGRLGSSTVHAPDFLSVTNLAGNLGKSFVRPAVRPCATIVQQEFILWPEICILQFWTRGALPVRECSVLVQRRGTEIVIGRY